MADGNVEDESLKEEIGRNNYGLVYKPIGKTPREVLDEYKEYLGKSKGAFYGRLDPMAHGIIKLYFEEKCKEATESSEKTYKFIMVPGFSSTSEDLLGYPKYSEVEIINEEKIKDALELLKGEEKQLIPVHSSYNVVNQKGEKRALWEWAKLRRLDEIERPLLKRKLIEYKIESIDEIGTYELIDEAIRRINLINRIHSFEQEEIINEYIRLKSEIKDKILQKITIEARVENGYYIRQLVRRISEITGIPIITFEIERIRYED